MTTRQHSSISDEMAQRLVAQYKSLCSGIPAWAYQLEPSIPFIGSEYTTSRPRIAVFASAENLTKYECNPASRPAYVRDNRRWNRHRACATDHASGEDAGFFRQVHIAPVEDGGLMCAALLIAERSTKQPPHKDPRAFIETLAVANVCKYSIATRTRGKNIDYAGKADLVAESLPYFRADLRALRPDILFLPKTIYQQPPVRAVVDEELPSVLVLAVPQFVGAVVNCHLSHHDTRAQQMLRERRGTSLDTWVSNVSGYRKENVYRYLVEVEDTWGAGECPAPR